MTLTTHAVVGAGIAGLFPGNPILAFVAGFLSHFVLDYIPHWDYSLGSARKDPLNPLNDSMEMGGAFVVDLLKIGLDILLGISLSLLFFAPTNLDTLLLVFLGACGGIVPDFLQFAYFKLRIEPFRSLQKFHIWIHARSTLKKYPLPGIVFQAIVIVAAVAFFSYF